MMIMVNLLCIFSPQFLKNKVTHETSFINVCVCVCVYVHKWIKDWKNMYQDINSGDHQMVRF